jgi:hypothetical protein
MPVFEITAPDGKTYDVEGADARGALAALQKHVGSPTVSAPPVSTAADVAKSAVSGVGKGLTGLAGLPGDLAEYGARGLDRATKFIGGKLGVDVPDRADRPPTFGSADIQKGVEGVTGEFYKPQTTYGKYAHTVGEFAPGILGGPGGLARKAITQVALPGVASEAAGQATEGKAAEPYARVAGALAGGLAPSAIGRAITPAPTSAGRQRLVDVLQGEGVTSLTAGQKTGNEALRYAESALGNAPFTGGAANKITREGQEQFTQAAMRRAGGGENAGPEVLAANQQRLGNEFQALSARNTLQMDQQFAGDVRQVIQDYGRVLPSEQRQQLYNVITDLAQHGNAIPGTVYQTTRSRLNRIVQNNRAGVGDAEFGGAMRGLRNALDDAMERSIIPADRGAWQAARREYSAQKTIEKAASKAGEATAEGQITPANLRNTVAANNRSAYARGEGDFSELARAGAGVMAPMPQSGTANRSMFYNIANLMTLGAAPAAAGRALMSGPVQSYLGNQIATPMLQNLNPRQQAVVGAMMAAEQQRLGSPH